MTNTTTAVSLVSDAQIAPHVTGALAILLAEHYKDAPPKTTLALYGVMLAEYDAELLKYAAIECVNQVKWFPKINEIEQIIRHIRALIEGGDVIYARKRFEARATVDARGALIEFRNQCKEQTLAYIAAERAKHHNVSAHVEDGQHIARMLTHACEGLAKAESVSNKLSAQYWRDYIAHLEARKEQRQSNV